MSRYDLSPPKREKFDRHKQHGLFLISMVVLLVALMYSHQSAMERYKQQVIKKDFDTCLNQICLIKDTNDCILLAEPTIANVRLRREQYVTGNVFRIEVEPLGHRCR